MKRNSIIFLTFLLTVTFICLAAAVSVFADGKGIMNSTYVNNTWTFVDSERTLYIQSNSRTEYNETGAVSQSDSWKPYMNRIEHIVLDGYFTKITTNAFKDHPSLRDVRINSNVTEIDGGAFGGCKNLESISVGNDIPVKGRADLSNVRIVRSVGSFNDTKLNEIILSEVTKVEGSENFNKNATVCVPRASETYNYLNELGRYNVVDASPVTLDIAVDGKKHSITYKYGTEITLTNIEGACVALYTDEAMTKPYGSRYAYENASLYGKKVIEISSVEARTASYQGIRMIYNADINAIAADSGFKVIEIGSIARMQDGFDHTLVEDTDNVFKNIVYLKGEYYASLLEDSENGSVKFAHTAVGFENGGKLTVERAEQNIFFRGYVTLYSENEDKTYTYYTDTEKYSLASVAAEYGKNAELNADEQAFVKASLDLGAVENYVYTKDELLAVLKKVSRDESRYIQGQHLGYEVKGIPNLLDELRAATGNDVAFVSFDIQHYSAPLSAKSLDIIEESKEFIRQGGIISFSYHMNNPTGNYPGDDPCRGELGSEEKWDELIEKGTELNSTFNKILDQAYNVLYEFDKDGYPVVWRPLHENNGDWFWWCAVQTFEENGTSVTRAIDQKRVIALWRYVYNYFTVEKGLKNLVWAYSPNVTNAASPVATTYCYPGDEYCDIAGVDWYTAGQYEVDGSGRSYLNLVDETGKMAALTEFGPGGDLLAPAGEDQSKRFSCRDQLDIVKRMIGDGMSPVYILNWGGNCSLLNMGETELLLNDKSVLNLSEVKKMFNTEYKKR